MSTRFGRTILVKLATRPREGKDRSQRAYQRLTQIENLRVQFEIKKTLKISDNSATITITNCASGTRAEFQTKPAHIELLAGYQQTSLSSLYKGDIYFADSRHDGAEWLTTVECGTGLNARSFGQTSVTFKGGAQVLSIAKKLASDMGLKVPKNVEEAVAMKERLKNGFTVSSGSLEQLQDLVKVRGFDASIQDDELVMLRDAEAGKAQALTISQATGMVGSPELGQPSEKGKPAILRVRTLLNPKAQVGRLLYVDAKNVTGGHVAQTVTHVGDTHGLEWFTDIEAVPRKVYV